jgi:hypothetical protein
MVSESDGYPPEVLDSLERLGFAVERRPQEAEEPDEPTQPAKRKGGRPRLPLTEGHAIEDEDTYADLGLVSPRIGREVTRRQGHNLFYAERAAEAFRGEYYDPRVNDLKSIVRTELGRLGEDEAIRAAFDRLWEAIDEGECSHRAQDQVALLRSWRRGGLPKGRVNDLQYVLEYTVQQYEAQHADVTDDMVIEALARAYWARKGE